MLHHMVNMDPRRDHCITKRAEFVNAKINVISIMRSTCGSKNSSYDMNQTAAGETAHAMQGLEQDGVSHGLMEIS